MGTRGYLPILYLWSSPAACRPWMHGNENEQNREENGDGRDRSGVSAWPVRGYETLLLECLTLGCDPHV